MATASKTTAHLSTQCVNNYNFVFMSQTCLNDVYLLYAKLGCARIAHYQRNIQLRDRHGLFG